MRSIPIILLLLLFLMIIGLNALYPAAIVPYYGHFAHIDVDSLTKNTHNYQPSPIDTPSLNITDTTQLQTDSNKTTTTDSTGFRISKDSLNSPVTYHARDSIVYDISNKLVHLYGDASVTHNNISLNADLITFDWANNTVIATGITDSSGKTTGQPIFKDGEQSYKAEKITYNFKTKKGKVYQVVTKEGEGYIHGEEVKKNTGNEWFGKNAKYTTCDLDHPHFYIQANKLMMIPDKLIVTGPANLIIADVPTPLYLPFGIFPIKQGRHSGILLPEYGESRNLGFFLKDGGYYFAISDYFDLALRGNIYSLGSWGLQSKMHYKKRYKYGGLINLQFARTRSGEPESKNFKVINDFKINWQHTQDPKARPYSRFSANLNIGTATYDKTYSYDANAVLNNSFQSSISYSTSFPRSPFNLNMSIRHDQSLKTHRINLNLPTIALNMRRVQPFQSKIHSGKKKWYEQIGFSWKIDAQNRITGIDSTFFTTKNLKEAKFGIKHTIPINTSFKVLKYFNLTPSFNYSELWYFQTIQKHWDPDTVYLENENVTDTLFGQVIIDTSFSFKPARTFTSGINLNTKLYGLLQFKRTKIRALRHVLTPTIGFKYTPDFGTDFWGYYKDVQINADGDRQTYSIYDNVKNIYGKPSAGKVAGINLNLNNTLEMKVFSKKDTVKHEKKIKLLEAFNISTFYNIAKDSLRLSPVNITGRTTLFDKIHIDFNAAFDPYIYDPDNPGKRLARFEWTEHHRPARLTNANISLSTSLRSTEIKKKSSPNASDEELKMINKYPDAYIDFNNPWSFDISYNLNIKVGNTQNPDTVQLIQSMNFGFDINVTPNWKIIATSGFDFVQKKMSYTTMNVVRDLHCWELKFRWVPFPKELQSYSIDLNVKSAVLQDLKLSKKKERLDNIF